MRCLQSAGGGRSAEDDASGRGDFSNWGRGGEAASGERRREMSLHKAAKLRKRQGFLEERNGRGREQSPGSFGAEGSILQDICDLVTPCAAARGDFQALTPCHHKRQESRGLLRSEIQDQCLQNYCTGTKASLGRGTGP